jgi:hypothetical protein
MPDYRCIAKCFHTVDTGRGLKHRFFREGDILSAPEGVEVPHHFVPADVYKEPEAPRLSNETSERYSKRQFPALIAPIDEAKVKRAKKHAQKLEKEKLEKKGVPSGSKDKSERVY